jgi:hypothetical protein
MQICAKCKKEMTCIKTGVICRWGADHCYAGDKYECLGCGAQTINANSSPYHYEGPIDSDRLIQMD